MIRKLFSVTIIALSLSVAAFPKDKEKDKEVSKPQLTDAQKVEILKAQVAVLNAAMAVQPQEIHFEQLRQELTAVQNKASDGVDVAKWKLNPQTLEFEAVPPPAPKPEEKKPEATPETK